MKEEILKYFQNTSKKGGLKVLDNQYRKQYTGVTLSYITYELLKAKYSKSDVAAMLLKLQKEKLIKSLFCPDIKKYVFESSKTDHYCFNAISGDYGRYGSKLYNVHIYLEKFIKKNE